MVLLPSDVVSAADRRKPCRAIDIRSEGTGQRPRSRTMEMGKDVDATSARRHDRSLQKRREHDGDQAV